MSRPANPKYSYDPECEKLARHFLQDELKWAVPAALETVGPILAQLIQDTVEGFDAVGEVTKILARERIYMRDRTDDELLSIIKSTNPKGGLALARVAAIDEWDRRHPVTAGAA